ncbi:MAG: protein translocase subunit SecD [Planctomycetaceae bacterium]|nr:protein translocase subunit SecD [Planctomycetaceae bacterium]
MTGVLVLFGVLALIVLPFVLGQLLANALKVKEWGFRIGVSLFALVLGLAPFIGSIMAGRPVTETIRLGIDLKGGTNIVYKVNGEGKEVTNEIMDRMVGAVGKRINPSGAEEIMVRQVGTDRLEVIVPGEDPQTVAELKRKLTTLGSLEFFIAADPVDDREIVEQGRSLDVETKELLDATGNMIAVWRQAYETNGVPKPQEALVSRPVEKLRSVDGKTEKYQTFEYLLLVDPPAQRITGEYLVSATPGYAPNGEIIVNFVFNQAGGFLFQNMTSENLPIEGRSPRKLAIVLDRKVFSAPQINSVIAERGYIEGGGTGFSVEEAQELSDVLNAGALEVPIDPKPLSEATVDPTLGADVRNKGVNSVIMGGAIVVVFMLFYYRLAGVVAIVSLALNIVLVLGTMVLINATFSLPGLAGIVLTIGMAVDANVLIYERMREELSRGSSLRMAIQNGFAKALSTIVDANVTTLLTAVVLFTIGTDQVKGFAITLFIGIVMSMFTALFVGRLLFDIIEKKRWASKLSMMSIVGSTNWDFLGKQKLCAVISVALIGTGLVAFFSRGQENYDIDFTGGTMVTMQFTEDVKTEDVREVLATQFTDAFTLERLAMDADTTEGVGRHFRLRTTESDSGITNQDDTADASAEERVRGKVFEAFKGNGDMKLRMVTMEFSDIQPIKIAEDDDSVEALQLKRFDGGSSADITLSDEVAAGTVLDNLSAALSRILSNGQPRYGEPSALIEIAGVEGSGMEAAEMAVRKYSKVTVRAMPAVEPDDLKTALTTMQDSMARSPLFDEVNTFASAVASEMKSRAVIAILLSMLVITAYIWFRFQHVTFGLAAVAALIHDVLFVMGMLALVSYINGTPIGNLLLVNDFRINLPMIAAFLTLVGYSLNDTIVVFDRIREVRGKNPQLTAEIVNQSLNQTLSRTLLTSLTTFLVVIVLYAFGGEGIHGFAFCLTVGIIIGTYSSIYVASPILVWLMNRSAKVAAGK